MSTTPTENKIKAKQHESYGTFTLIAILLAPIGLILGIVYLTKDDKLDKKLGEHLLATSVIWGIIGSLIWLLIVGFIGAQGGSPTPTVQYVPIESYN